MFSLLHHLPGGVNRMLKDWEVHIAQQGLKDLMESAEVINTHWEQYVKKFLELFDRFSTLVEKAFNNDPRFLSSKDKAFKDLLVGNDTSKHLQNSAMKLVEAERNGESFDPQLVIAVRESFC